MTARFLIVLATLFLTLSGSALADASRAIVTDIPLEQAIASFGKAPGSALTAGDSATIAKQRFDGDTLKVLVVLVEWSDRPGTYSRETLDSMLFSRDTYPTGSMADWFYENSYGQLTVTGDVIDWVNAGFYNSNFDFESILPALDAEVDFSQYDANGDNVADAVIFLRSGTGEEDSHDPNDIWSYAYIYTLGGNIGLSGYGGAMTSNVADVNFNQLNMTTSASGNAGSLVNTSWTKTTALPALRGFSAGAIATSFNSLVPAAANGFVYVLGGLDASGTAQNTVYYAQINSDGTVGTWNTTTSLPQPLFGHAVAIFHGRLYVAGGNDASGTPTKTVYSAVIEVDGTLGFWSTYTALPTAVAYHQLVTAGGVLYILGGTSSAGVNPTSSTQSAASSKTVYYNLINIVDGTLAASWMTNSNSMIKNDEKHTAVAVGANILVSGGLFGATGSTSFQTGEEYYAAVNADGSLGSFNGATGSNTINSVSGTTFFNHSVAFFADAVGKPHVLILGGQDILGSVMNADVWYQQ